MILSDATLANLPSAARRPGYDRSKLGVGVVHFGMGAFQRAHQASYLEDLIEREGGDWGVVGVNLKTSITRERLAPQDGLYTLLVRDGAKIALRVIGCVRQVLVAPEEPEAIIKKVADPKTRLLTLTVTEKGYCLNRATQRLDPENPDILADRIRPTSALGFIAAGLDRRRKQGLNPPTILSCDNLPDNGAILRQALIDSAAMTDRDLSRWIEDKAVVPSTMIDRIVPAATDADRADVRRLLGVEDRAAVSTEPFTQWVVEDTLDPALKGLAEVGVEIVPEVAPYERMKLRLLNGPHSAIAYLGQLLDKEHVVDAVSDPAIRRFIGDLQREELAPTVGHFPPDRLATYCRELMERWDNAAIRHRTAQIAMDGSQKLPQRIVAPIVERLKQGVPVSRSALVLAAWIRYLGGMSESGRPLQVSDPLSAKLEALAKRTRPPADIVDDMLGLESLFPADLAQHEGFRKTLISSLDMLASRGARAAMEAT